MFLTIAYSDWRRGRLAWRNHHSTTRVEMASRNVSASPLHCLIWLRSGVGVGKDHTLYALHSGQVYFTHVARNFMKIKRRDRTFVNVVPAAHPNDALYRYVR